MSFLTSGSNNACCRAAQLLIAILMVLLLGKLITLVPIMHQLMVFDTFRAADIVWFVAKATALVAFFLFAHYLIDAMPNDGGVRSFVKGIAEPAAVLVIVIIGQTLLWHLLEPFVASTGRTVYFSVAIVLIVAVSIWLILKTYQNALFFVDAVRKGGRLLLRLFPDRRVVCDQCQAEIAASASYCSQCGHKMPKPLRCSECGKQTSAGQKYCQNCGAALNLDIGLK